MHSKHTNRMREQSSELNHYSIQSHKLVCVVYVKHTCVTKKHVSQIYTYHKTTKTYYLSSRVGLTVPTLTVRA